MGEVIWADLNRKTPGPVAKIRTRGGATAIIYNDDYINKTPEQIREVYYRRALAMCRAYGVDEAVRMCAETEREIAREQAAETAAKQDAPRTAGTETQG